MSEYLPLAGKDILSFLYLKPQKSLFQLFTADTLLDRFTILLQFLVEFNILVFFFSIKTIST